ncbi:unnamed protein product [Agarophyton chilense]
MAYDSVRAQLDKLLGVDRNGPLTESAINEPPNYRDAKFCKHYLLGFCPNDLYIKQRSEPGSCRLEHSETAKSSFEKDEAEGRVREDEKLRWMRALLSECRTIVAEEDRKIRGQARRLQESYGCGGELSGLMIRNFDTLKKLGMVSQNAKIRVLSEIDENEPLSDDDTTMLHTSRDHSADANVDNLTKPEPTNNSDLPNEVQSNSLKGAESEEINNPGSDIKKDAGEEDEGENDDDLDGFGLIKVIPAGDTPEDPATNENVKEKGSSRSATDTKPTVTPTLDNPIGTEKSQMANKSKQPEAESNAENCTLDCTGEKIVSLASDEGEKKEENNLMDKFYEIGVGPDGLQMLDRKQSKRVCACCGGYISLVDAESRLLSHFGATTDMGVMAIGSMVAFETTRIGVRAEIIAVEIEGAGMMIGTVIPTRVSHSTIHKEGKVVARGIQMLVMPMTTGTVRDTEMMIMTMIGLPDDMTGTMVGESVIDLHHHIVGLDVGEGTTKWTLSCLLNI